MRIKYLITYIMTHAILVSPVFSSEVTDESSAKYKKGMAMVDKLFPGADPDALSLSDDFTKYTVEHLFGDVWQGDQISLKERSLATCTVLIAMNRTSEQKIHFTAARNLGIPREKLEEIIAHVAHYAGWPVAMSAFHTLNEVWPTNKVGKD
ncbi:MAG: carboxymuconolactone decarboxylase family protein [Porticoccaceae bacterium]|jgi:4-carboxymuconolactone decarboxylase|nr:carboxymuconolactone decarboxylase family protein [Porticoccaceae bacterium]